MHRNTEIPGICLVSRYMYVSQYNARHNELIEGHLPKEKMPEYAFHNKAIAVEPHNEVIKGKELLFHAKP